MDIDNTSSNRSVLFGWWPSLSYYNIKIFRRYYFYVLLSGAQGTLQGVYKLNRRWPDSKLLPPL